MKNKLISIIAGLLIAAGGGTAIYNYTGEDITQPDGTILKSEALVEHLTKNYVLRNVNKPLTIDYHHTAGPKTQKVENIARYHVGSNGWPAIAYHIAVDYKGGIYLLNHPEEKTYHNSKNNTNGIGVVAIGNYETEEPTPEMINAIKKVDHILRMAMTIKHSKGHKDYKATLCPGKYLYQCLIAEEIINL